jgi:hypothetical protein
MVYNYRLTSNGPREGVIETPLEDLLFRIKLTEQTQPLAVSLKGGFGDEADELGAHGGSAVATGLFSHGCIDFAHRGAGEVGDIHGDLGLTLRGDTHGFDSSEASTGLADIFGDGAGYGNFGCIQKEVEGDEETAGSNG